MSTLVPADPAAEKFKRVNTRPQDIMVSRLAAYRHGKSLGDISIEDISEVLQQEETFVWMGLRDPSDALLDKLQEEFGLHELSIEDTRSAQQRPKLEEYASSLFLVLQTIQLSQGAIQFGETHVFVGARFLITVRHGSTLSYRPVRERCESQPEQLAKGPGFALYAVLDFIVDNYMPAVDFLEERLDSLEEDIFKNRFNSQTLEDLYELKRQLVRVRDAVAPMVDICSALMRFHGHIVPKEIRLYFRDVHDHIERINRALDNMREMLTAAMQAHLALITVRQNEIVKRLAGWGAILAIPTMLFSLYGMNFKFMPELDWPFSYPALLGLVTVSCIVLYVQLKKSGWL